MKTSKLRKIRTHMKMKEATFIVKLVKKERKVK